MSSYANFRNIFTNPLDSIILTDEIKKNKTTFVDKLNYKLGRNMRTTSILVFMITVLIPILLSGFIWQYALLIHKPLELKEKTGTMLLFILISAIITIIGNNIFLPI